MRKKYPSDLSDAEWNSLREYLPTPKAQGRPRTHPLRDVLDAIFYVLKTGCQWRFLPHDFPPWSSVYYHFRRFRLSGLCSVILKVLREAERKRVGKDPQPTAAIMDSQSVKTTEESAHPSGYDAHKNVKGRKRHLLVDTLGLLLSVYVKVQPTYKTGVGREVFFGRTKATFASFEEDFSQMEHTQEKS